MLNMNHTIFSLLFTVKSCMALNRGTKNLAYLDFKISPVVKLAEPL